MTLSLKIVTGAVRGEGGAFEPVTVDTTDGVSGWSPLLGAEADGARRLVKVVDWVGGGGTKPAGGYIGSDGLKPTTVEAFDFEGGA